MADDELKLRITPEVDEDALKRIGDELDRLHKPADTPVKPGKGASDAIKKDIQTRIDLRDLELRRIQSASAEEIKFLQQRAAQGKITTTQMVSDIQLVENAQEVATQNALKDYNALQSEIMRTTELTKAQATALEKKLFFAQERASTGFVSMSRSMGGLQSSTKDANIAFANFGRIVQDAPFGLLGISNNIDPLLNSFAALKASTGSTALALRAMGATLLGPAGLIFLLGSLLPTALLFAQKAMAKNKAETDKATESLTDYQRALRSASQTQVSDAIPSTLTYTEQIEALNKALIAVSSSIGVQNLEIVNAGQFFKNGAVDILGYTRAQERLGSMTDATREVLAKSSQEVFGATIQEDEAVREIIQSKINEAKANQAIADALRRLGVARRKSADELRRERQEQEDFDFYMARRGATQVLDGETALIRVARERGEAFRKLQEQQADESVSNAMRVGEGEIEITQRTILAKTQLYKQGEAVVADAVSAGSRLRMQLFENEQEGLIRTMDLTTSIARNMFGDIKEVAVAEALVNTYVAITRAAREYPFPLSAIIGSLELANGLATVSRIRNTNIGSGSSGSSAPTVSASVPSFDRVSTTSGVSSMYVASTASNSMIQQPNINISATADRQGLAIAVREGEAEIRSQQIAFS